jgi:hypothetical protein
MGEKYFNNFQVINYANSAARNIMERVVVLDSVLKNAYSYYPYDLSEGVRPDQLSNVYYNDPFMDWTLYLGNKVIDPYHQWYIQPYDFEKFLRKKYNTTIPIIQSRVQYYRNEWYGSIPISTAEFEALDYELKKYWEPTDYDTYGNIVSYSRKRLDWEVNTNKIVRYAADGSSLIKGERLDVIFTSDVVGHASVHSANSTYVIAQHTSGYVVEDNDHVAGPLSCLVGFESRANVNFTSANLVAQNIPTIEEPYWQAVTLYDVESDRNDQYRSIKVLSKSLAPTVASQLKELLSG